jgi:FKBP-type peptidyl-prolyl cis-trans isomerase/cyclophilin family peptidyl-prolyl cis-trans isomerase
MTAKPATLSAPMPDRWDNDLPNNRGTVALIRGQGPAGTGSAEFFINVVDNRRLDAGPARALASVFGTVIEGMDVADAIRHVPVTTHPNYAEGRSAVVPADPVIIRSIVLLTPLVAEKLQAAAEAMPSAESRADVLMGKLAAEAGRPEVKTESGLRYVDQRIGEGAMPLAADLVEFQYRGTLLNGVQFESTYEKQPAVRRVQDLIPGLQEALTTMNEGGKRTVMIPSDRAFGEGGVPGFIPGGATVVFEVELLAIR